MDSEQLTSIVQLIVTSGGAVAVMYLWIRSLQEDLKYARHQLEESQDKYEKAMQTQIEWQRYEQMKNLPHEATRPLPPRWQGDLRERVEDN